MRWHSNAPFQYKAHCSAAGVGAVTVSAVLQAYGRAIELEPRRLFSLVQSGLVLLALGNFTEAQGLLQTALEVDPQHVPALFAAAQLLLASAKYGIAQGTPGSSCTLTLPMHLPLLMICQSGRIHTSTISHHMLQVTILKSHCYCCTCLPAFLKCPPAMLCLFLTLPSSHVMSIHILSVYSVGQSQLCCLT